MDLKLVFWCFQERLAKACPLFCLHGVPYGVEVQLGSAISFYCVLANSVSK